MYVTDNYLTVGCDALKSTMSQPCSPDYMFAIANIKMSAQNLAIKMKESSSMDEESHETNYFFNEAEKCFQFQDFNNSQSATGPLFYIIRYIARKFGISTLMNIIQNENFLWILPSTLNKVKVVLICIPIH